MREINLLPWREELRRIKNNVFFILTAASIVLGIIIVFLAHFLFQCWVNIESQNIELIHSQQKDLLSQIQEIQNLQKDKTELLRRREIIEVLQEDRPLLVRLLDALPHVIPESVVLTSVERKGIQVTILGSAETPIAISKFYNNLEDPCWKGIFTDIKINEIALEKKQTGVGFKLEFTLSNSK